MILEAVCSTAFWVIMIKRSWYSGLK